jgi:N6-adenosine-specific RNA methylase IME4
MGIRGTIRRSDDSHLVHCNVDLDVICWEGDPDDPLMKPPELFTLIENFCLGTRRVELFGTRKSLRRGWLTVGPDVQPFNVDELDPKAPRAYVKEEYEAYFGTGKNLVPFSPGEVPLHFL